MFSSERLVYIELHKTGCTHILKLLSQLVDGQVQGKHNPPSPELRASGRWIMGSIRDPWEWYLSLWAYGCDGKGDLYRQLTSRRRRIRFRGWRSRPGRAARALLQDVSTAGRWQRSYADVNDPARFRDWLHRLHDRRWRHDLGEGFGDCPTSEFAGLLSYRYLRLYCPWSFVRAANPERLAAYEREHCFVDHFIRNERLEDDLIHGLQRAGLPLSPAQRRLVFSAGRTNRSSWRAPIGFYYDAASVALVAARERLVIDRFGYQAPLLSGAQGRVTAGSRG
ncbi:MAG: hypothetical protein ACNA7W_14415 [Pseudomonadales bacterium]